jgi:glycosyltransferase involved in cell wall biosynthesis
MNILLTIHEHLDPNAGVAGSTLRLGQEYQKLGHQVTYYSYNNLPKDIPSALKYLIFPFWVTIFLWRQNSKQKFDVVDAHTGDLWLWAKLLSKLQAHAPLLVTRSHGLEHIYDLQAKDDAARGDLHLSWKYRLYRGGVHLWEVTQSLRHADLVLMRNSEERKHVEEVLGISPDKIHTVPYGIPDYFLDLPFVSIADEDTTIRIAQVSTFIPRKGIKFSIAALNNILSNYPNVEMSFLGTACKQCTNVEEVYANFDLDIRDRIKVIPRYSHETLPELLKGYHIKLFPSLSEAFGMALIEAMACGLAPITTAAGGPLDIISDRHDGWLVPLRDSKSLEVALEKLIGDRRELNRLRQNAYHKAQTYSWRSIAQTNISWYQEAIKYKAS